MAATIRSRFGIDAELIEGHGGIYEFVINGETVYSNKSTCGRFPTDEEIFTEIRRFREPFPEGEKARPEAAEVVAPSCCLPDNSCC